MTPEELRKLADAPGHVWLEVQAALRKAADEIERLQKQCLEWRSLAESLETYRSQLATKLRAAREALKE